MKYLKEYAIEIICFLGMCAGVLIKMLSDA